MWVWLAVCVRVCVRACVCVCVCFHVKEFANVPEHHDSVEAWVSPNPPTHLPAVSLFDPTLPLPLNSPFTGLGDFSRKLPQQ